MTRQAVSQVAKQDSTNHPLSRGILQRKCESCGQHTMGGGKCESCEKQESFSANDNEQDIDIQRKSASNLVDSSFNYNFSGVPVSTTSLPIQPKLKIGKPNDRYEQEADRIADQVMRMPESQVTEGIQRMTDEEEEMMQPKPISGTIQRMCTECKEEKLQRMEMDEEEEEVIQTKHDNGGVSAVTPNIQSGINRLRQGEGVNLPPSTQGFMESRFGHPFSDIKIHTSPQATDLSRRVNARAFTVGRDIFFGQGEFQPNTPSGMRLLAHELTHTIQQSRTPLLRRVPNDSEEEQSPKAKRAIVVCGLGGKGTDTGGTLTFETDAGLIVYGLEVCRFPAGIFENVLVLKDHKDEGKIFPLFFDFSGVPEKTGKEDDEFGLFDFEFRPFGLNPDPRTLFDFSNSEEAKLDFIVNPHELFLEDIEGKSFDEAGLRISEIYNEVELRAILKSLEQKAYFARGKEKARLLRLIKRVEQQLAVAETQAIRAEEGDELGIDPEVSERIEDHPELAPRLESLHEKLLLTIAPTAKQQGYEDQSFFKEDKKKLATDIRNARKKWEKVRGSVTEENKDAANQYLRLEAAVRLLEAYSQVANAQGVELKKEGQQALAKWKVLVSESLAEAEFLSETSFISVGKRRLAVRKEVEEHESRVELAFNRLKNAYVVEPSGLSKAGTGVASHTTASDLVTDLLRGEFSASEVREALERLSEEEPTQFKLVMASGQLSLAFLELAEARGKGAASAKAELSSLHSEGQGFLVGYSLRAQELQIIDPQELEVDLSHSNVVDTVEAFVEGLFEGFGKGLKQIFDIIVDIILVVAVKSEREKFIKDLTEFVTKLFTDEKFRFAAGAATAEIVHDAVKKFNASNLPDPAKSIAQAKSMGELLGQVIFEILVGFLSGGAINAAAKMAQFRKMRAVLRLARMTSTNALGKALASKLFDLSTVVVKAGERITKIIANLKRKIPGLTSQKKLADAVFDMEALDDLQKRVAKAAQEVKQVLERMDEIANMASPDPNKWSKAVEDLAKAERKLELEVKTYNSKAKADSADTLLARQSSLREGPASQEELRAELEILYEQLRFDKKTKEVKLFDDAKHSYKKIGNCWVRHSSPTKPKDLCLKPPKQGENIEAKATQDAARAEKELAQALDNEVSFKHSAKEKAIPYTVRGSKSDLDQIGGTSVYVLKNKNGKVLYVGEGNVWDRLRSHIGEKRAWSGDIAEIEVQGTKLTKKQAHALEEDLIDTLNPQYNIEQKPYEKNYPGQLRGSDLPPTQKPLKFQLEWGHLD